MRYLLTFHSETAGQWRCLDSARLAAFGSGPPRDLPQALNRSPRQTIGWMLGARHFGPFTPLAVPGQDETIHVYALDPDSPVIGEGNDYYGAWLEMFMRQNQPLGWIAAQKPAGFAHLAARAAQPLAADDRACQQTMDLMRSRQRQPARTRRQAEQA